MEGIEGSDLWCDDDPAPTTGSAPVGDVFNDPDGFKMLPNLELLDGIFSAMGQTSVDQFYKPSVIVDPTHWVWEAVVANMMPDDILKPECVRLVPSGTVYFYFSLIQGDELELRAGWLFGIAVGDLEDVVPELAAELKLRFKSAGKLSLTKLAELNTNVIGQRKRIVDAINNHMAVKYQGRAGELERAREVAKKAHYEKSEDTGMF